MGLMRPLRSGGVLLVDHDTSFVEWRSRNRHPERKRRFSYHPMGSPPGASLVARLGVSGPRLPAISLRWPRAAQWLSTFFVYPPLNRVATQLLLVYRKL
jgi:hypothetical protein